MVKEKLTFTESVDELKKAWRSYILEIRMVFIFNKDTASVIRRLQRENWLAMEALEDLAAFKHFPTSQNPKYAAALEKGNIALTAMKTK